MPYRDPEKKREAERRRRARLREVHARDTRDPGDPPPRPGDLRLLAHTGCLGKGWVHFWDGSRWQCAHCFGHRAPFRAGEPVWLLFAGRYAVRGVLAPAVLDGLAPTE
jgi:hypothetical protein